MPLSSPRHAPKQPAHSRLDGLDGIRTVAVFLVVLFHVSAPHMAAGFIGVDVFFVLSGYLITSGLVREIGKTRRIALATFWARRFKRLLPAALLVIAGVLVWSHVWADFYRRPSLAQDAWATLAYVANWRFIGSASYFSNDGTASPLLHMWSLAVEEQFYLLWPITVAAVCWVIRRRGGDGRRMIRAASRISLLVVAVSAVLLSWRYAPDAPDRAYMGTDTKAFEPMLGAFGALMVSRPQVRESVARQGRILAVLGLAVLLVLFPFLDGPSHLYFRGGALAFSLGSLLLILGVAHDGNGVLAQALGWGPVAYLGRISYGIYLWHWPYAVWLGTAHTVFTWWRAALVIVLTIGTASASYHFVELPIRSGRVALWLTTRRTLVTSGAWLAAMAAVITVLGGTPLSPVLSTAAASEARSGTAGAVRPPFTNVLMVGDSVPLRLMPALAPLAKKRGITLFSAMGGGCSPLAVNQLIAPDDVEGVKCPAIAKTQAQAVASFDPGTVVWWSRYETAPRYLNGKLLNPGTPDFWAAQTHDFETALDRLTSGGAVVVVVLAEPPGIGMKSRCSPKKCHPFLQSMVMQDDLRVEWNAIVTRLAATDPRIRVTHIWDTICHPMPAPEPGAPWGSALCDDTVGGGKVARPDGSHFDLPLVGNAVATTVLDRAMAAAR